MTKPARRWTMGCGCGCALLLLVLGLLAWAGYRFVRDVAGRAERAEATMAEVRERYGAFRPRPNETLPPDRIEAFIHARELMAGERADAEASLSLLSGDGAGDVERVPGLLGRLLQWSLGVARVEGVTSLLPRVIGFVSARSEALLEAGMGPDEYLYLYSITYYSWLGRSPTDGPSFNLVGDEGEGQRAGQDEFDVRERRRELVLSHLNQQLLPLLRGQLSDLDQGGSGDSVWRRRLAAEVEALEGNPFRIPWRDGLPEPMAASLEPYRRELESSYSVLCNPLEVVPGSGG